ncbi:copper chaperone CopZ [Okibacterium sp. HSC-33S16]|uniref:heavy-metal-associated domain-containing protein n=1 Tax=Okibacterium sp. HSC-33S16 TaxID=2910965 RepID=UPI00209D0BC5|nr:heavy-metal-associated domain-containing protein [Okibacterium sp. HSC-33S16]MCP2032189.1 copper chaperone CopZ [Okibacterium sp. HSC-33S16]
MPAHLDLGLTARTDSPTAAGGCGCGHGGGGCMCGGHGADSSHGHAAVGSPAATAVVTELSVSGMTCGHCVKSVTEELAEIYGVNGVDVKLNPEGVSSVTVLSEAPLDKAHVAAAIEEAGYSLVAAPLSAD